jgi:MFS family permease
MIKVIVERLLRPRHYWRNVGFSELSELYVSIMFRGLAISLTGLFVPLYMLQLHYSVADILMLVAWYFTLRALFIDLLAGYMVAKFGPKHVLLIGYMMLIASTVLFLSLPAQAWPLWFMGGVWGAAASFFFIPFNVDFSKVKHRDHGGKELGFVYIMEKFGSALGPLVGGLVATIFGAQYIFLIAIGLLFVGIVPLFRTAEPVRLNQKLDFKSLKADGLKHDFISYVGIGIENTVSLLLWPLFLGAFVLIGRSGYAKLGIISSLSVLMAIISAYAIGKLIDKSQGRRMLRLSSAINALLHLVRPFTASYLGAFLVNMVNETITVGYRMPFYKGIFDAADDLPGYRIVYLTSMEIVSSTAKATAWWILFLLASTIPAREALSFGFLLAAAMSLLIWTEKFKALDTRHIMNNKHA